MRRPIFANHEKVEQLKAAINKVMDYIHYNPVKHGLVQAPGDWQHSSFN